MKTTLGILLIFVAFGCSNYSSSDFSLKTNVSAIHFDVKNKTLNLIENKCYACHNPNTASHDDILAPPLAAIKRKYLNTYPTEQEFVAKMSSFLLKPTKKKAIGPVKRFGLMPKQALTKEEAKDISRYMFKEELEYPNWLPKHWKEKHGGKL